MTGPREGEARRPVTTAKWQPGDVALVRSGYGNVVVGLRCGIPSNMGWAHADALKGYGVGNSWMSDPQGALAVRRLVVLDPEDRDQIAHLQSVVEAEYKANPSDAVEGYDVRCYQRGLRVLAGVPRVTEPTGLGAVVEDEQARLWIRTDQAEWTSAGDFAEWPAIDASRVLSEGITR